MDRNWFSVALKGQGKPVALRKESVDRNVNLRVLDGSKSWSLSARRAWIEMLKIGLMLALSLSLSARRAWIEILPFNVIRPAIDGRSPQGERG